LAKPILVLAEGCVALGWPFGNLAISNRCTHRQSSVELWYIMYICLWDCYNAWLFQTLPFQMEWLVDISSLATWCTQ